jgi:hypothetical protein
MENSGVVYMLKNQRKEGKKNLIYIWIIYIIESNLLIN